MITGPILPIMNHGILSRLQPLPGHDTTRQRPPTRAPLSITRLSGHRLVWASSQMPLRHNPRRIHAGLGGLSPEEYEDAYHRAAPDPHT